MRKVLGLSLPSGLEPTAVARLRPYGGNARTHSKKQVRQIADSINRFGFTNPVLISDDGEIIAGHLPLRGHRHYSALAAVCPCRRSDQAAMDIIDYVATESAGLASTSTRTITAPVVGLNASRHEALELSGPAATLTL